MDTTCNFVWRSGLIETVTHCCGLFDTKSFNSSCNSYISDYVSKSLCKIIEIEWWVRASLNFGLKQMQIAVGCTVWCTFPISGLLPFSAAFLHAFSFAVSRKVRTIKSARKFVSVTDFVW